MPVGSVIVTQSELMMVVFVIHTLTLMTAWLLADAAVENSLMVHGAKSVKTDTGTSLLRTRTDASLVIVTLLELMTTIVMP